jgi:IPT/TIG domain
MATITVTDADVGNTIESDGVLTDIKLLTVPTIYTNDYFCLTDKDTGRAMFNMHIASSNVSAGSVLLANGRGIFKELVLTSIPPGSSFEIETKTAAELTPVLSSLDPSSAISGDPDFTLSCIGTGFTPDTTINFGGRNEPATFVSDTEVTTVVKPSLFDPAVVPVYVRTGPFVSDPIDFTFDAPAEV